MISDRLVLIEPRLADDEVLPREKVGAVDGQRLLIQFLGLHCVSTDNVIGTKDKITEFVVGMSFDESLAALSRLVVDIG